MVLPIPQAVLLMEGGVALLSGYVLEGLVVGAVTATAAALLAAYRRDT